MFSNPPRQQLRRMVVHVAAAVEAEAVAAVVVAPWIGGCWHGWDWRR